MALNKNIQSPTFKNFVLGDTAASDIRPTLSALDIWSVGNVHIMDIEGIERTRTFTTAMIPYRWIVQIKRVFSTGTTVPIGDLDGLHC